MPEPKESQRGATCGACGYANPPGAHACGLCGTYLFSGSGAPSRTEGGPAAPYAPLPRPAVPAVVLRVPEKPVEVPRIHPSALRELLRPDRSLDDLYPAPAAPRAAEPAPLPAPEELRVAAPARRPAASAEPLRDVRAGDAAAADELRRRRHGRLWKHALASALVAFAVQALTGWTGLGPPATLASLLLRSALFGFPVGYCVSRVNGGPIQGLGIGAFFGALSLVPAALHTLASDGALPGMLELALGLGAGVVPGVVIGVEVQTDT